MLMDLEFEGKYFNATRLINQRNQNTLESDKRQFDFHNGARHKAIIKAINSPFITLGGGVSKSMWAHRDLLPIYLAWLSPDWYMALANAEWDVNNPLEVPDILTLFDREAG